jgi:hypothetical protein
MWLVRVALERPYTFVVLALLVFILSNRAQCESIVAKSGSIPDNHDLPTVLTCRQITGV